MKDHNQSRPHKNGESPVRKGAGALAAGLLGVLLALTLLRSTPAPVAAAGPNDAAAVADAIERLPVVGSVLLTGAHPDDENNALLAYLARGMHLRTAYLSATRGDGGQNLLGTEQYEALGILRTEELMAARRLDGAEQFFAQAYDFGFSKDPVETLQKWGHDNVLGDYVRVIRQFRPDIIISRFTGTAADGHGHHQASGILTKEAFAAAADPNQFPEQLKEGLQPWQARWLFINQGGGGGGRGSAPGTFTITLGGFNPLYGEELGDLGAEARSQHRSQGMGQSGGRGPYTASFRLWEAAPGVTGTPKDLFEGIDLTLNRIVMLASSVPAIAENAAAIEQSIARAKQRLAVLHPEGVLPDVSQGAAQLLEMRDQVTRAGIPEGSKQNVLLLLDNKIADFSRAVYLAGGVSVDATADHDELVPGSSFEVTVRLQSSGVKWDKPKLEAPPSWRVVELSDQPSTPTSSSRLLSGTHKFRVTVPQDAPLTQPYWLAHPRQNDHFDTSGNPSEEGAYAPALLSSSLELVSGAAVRLPHHTDVVYRFTDRIYGERERPLAVVPALGVWLEPGVAVFPEGQNATRAFLARVLNNSDAEQKGTLRLQLPDGWRANPSSVPFMLAKKGDEFSTRFEVTQAPPSGAVSQPTGGMAGGPARFYDPSAFSIAVAIAEAGGKEYYTGYQVIDYPHIQTRYWFQPAMANLQQFGVKVAPGLKVGYIMGSGDDVPNALKQLGVEVTELTTDDLAFGDLSRFNVIVTGIRAYEVRKDISANNVRLMDWVKNGGLMIAQYSRPGGFSDILAPYAMKIGANDARVAVEEAPVEILEPTNPLFRFPNEITAKDFDGWVQERGTYFMTSWAPEFTPLLESHDPGEPPQKGGMLVAKYGKGMYVYTGYVWFRQLPAGVPGAYRMFANMISLGKAPQK